MNVKDLGSILGIWAHPDDETFCAGGLLAMAAANGQRVANITATKGEAGAQNPAENLGQIREQELGAALAILGAPTHEWLGYNDGRCDKIVDISAVRQLVPLISKYSPDTIITFAQDGLTGHPDHQAVSRWTAMAVKSMDSNIRLLQVVVPVEGFDSGLKILDDKFNAFFAIDKPRLYSKGDCDLAIQLSEEILNKKLAALKAQASQFDDWFKNADESVFRQAFVREWFKSASF